MTDPICKPEVVIDDEGTEVVLSLDRTFALNRQQRLIEGFTKDGEYWGCYTIFIPNIKLTSGQTILDTNNAPDILKTLESKGIVNNTGMMAASGYCEYPIVEFTDKAKSLFTDLETEH